MYVYFYLAIPIKATALFSVLKEKLPLGLIVMKTPPLGSPGSRV